MGRIECALPLQGRAAAAARAPPEAPAGGEAAPRAERRAWARDAPQAPHGLSSMRILQGPSRRTESGTGTDGPRRQSDGGVDPLATAPRGRRCRGKGRRSNATQWRVGFSTYCSSIQTKLLHYLGGTPSIVLLVHHNH
jgi:hypothetical protein